MSVEVPYCCWIISNFSCYHFNFVAGVSEFECTLHKFLISPLNVNRLTEVVRMMGGGLHLLVLVSAVAGWKL